MFVGAFHVASRKLLCCDILFSKMKKNVISELELKKRLVLQVLLRQQHLHHGVQIQNPVDSLANLLSGQYIILIYLSCVEHR